MPDHYLLLVTTGTSLLTNKGGKAKGGDDERSRAVARLNSACEESPLNSDSILSQLKGLDPEQETNFRNTPDDDRRTDRLPQELSYLYILLARSDRIPNNAKVSVVLLASDTDHGRLCANIVTQYLNDGKTDSTVKGHEAWGRITEDIICESVKGLLVDINNTFEIQGHHNLVAAVKCYAESIPGAKVVLNITGGFKGAVPYTTLASLLMPNVELDYLFENSPHIIRLPIYPLGLDFELWQGQVNLIEAAVKRPDVYRSKLHLRLQNVFQNDGSLSPLGELMRQRAQDLIARDPFQELVCNTLEDLLPHEELRNQINQVLNKAGSFIWTADKAPMAAEHAQRHHYNLFALAQTALHALPNNVLSPEEVYCLLAALLLHDCGHVLGAVEVNGELISLFPQEIRRLHHWLAWHRLGDQKMAEQLGWDATHKLANTVRWLAVYHRKVMGGFDDRPPREDPLAQLFPAWKWKSPETLYKGEKIVLKPDRFRVLVTLLRLIDSCDNQSRRVGTSAEVAQVLAAFDRDAQHWQVRAQPLIAAATKYATSCGKKQLLEALHKWAQGEKSYNTEVIEQGLACPGIRRPGGGDGISPEQAAILREVLRCYDEWSMRDNQWDHFKKHQCVQRVDLLPEESEGFFFRVELHEAPDSSLDEKTRTQSDKTFRKWIEDDISGEVSPEAAQILAQNFGGCSVKWFWYGCDNAFAEVCKECDRSLGPAGS